jgi:hypothetical protein
MKRIFLSVFLLSILAQQITIAQWSSDPAQNKQISSGTDGTAVTYVVTHTCGTSYISWFTPSPGGDYYPWIQQIDAQGYTQWASPLQVSSNPSMTWITDYSLAVTPDTSALVAFQDIRTGNNDIFIYKIGQDGQFQWGDDGIQLSSDPAFEVNPVMAVHADGSVVAAWPRMPDVGDSKVILQRLNSAGQKTWANDLVLGETGYDYTWPRVIPAENGNTIVVYYKEWGYFSAPNRIIYAQKINSNGSNVWSSKPVLFNGVMPVYVHPQVAPDGNGGAFVTWMYERTANHLSSFVQHVSADGTVTMETNGAEVSTNAGTLALEPAIGCDETSHSAYIFWRETDLNQNVFGLFGQRMDVNGNRKWGNNGIQIEALGTQNAILPTVSALPGGAIVGYEYDFFGSGSDQMIKACRLDSTGVKVWTGNTRTMSSAQSSKGSLASGPRSNSQIVYAWSDDRTGGDQVFAQNLCENGSFGPVDDSFTVDPDTLYFLTPDDVFNGKTYHIINPHDYSLDLQYIKQEGTLPPEVIPWYSIPWYSIFPVNIPAGDSLGITVKWPVLDGTDAVTILYDTVNINTINTFRHVIIAVDSSLIIMGLKENEKYNFSAFPNPFLTSLDIYLNVQVETDAEVTVYNTLMQLVLNVFHGKLNKGSNHLTWDGKNMNGNDAAPGVYLIVIRVASGQQTVRVVKF